MLECKVRQNGANSFGVRGAALFNTYLFLTKLTIHVQMPPLLDAAALAFPVMDPKLSFLWLVDPTGACLVRSSCGNLDEWRTFCLDRPMTFQHHLQQMKD